MRRRSGSIVQPTGRERRALRRIALAASLAGFSLAASASPASAAVTIGQLDPGVPTTTCATQDFDGLQASITSGTSYLVPAAGTLTSWSHNARAASGQQLTMKVFRKVADPATYQVVGHDGPRNLTGGVLNTFPTNIAVQPGDVLGLNTRSPTATACGFGAAPGDTIIIHGPALPDGTLIPGLQDGDSGAFGMPDDSVRFNISAVVEPTNAFTLGTLTRNKKKGTVTLNLTLPNSGELSASGKGVKAASAAISKAVAAGPAQLLIKAKGKKKKKLKKKGKVKLNVSVAYTPTGGDPSTQSVKVKLKKKRKKG